MLKFSVPQKEFTIGDITIGGPPGQNPPVLSGSIFFTGHLLVKDPKKGSLIRIKSKDRSIKMGKHPNRQAYPVLLISRERQQKR